MRLKNQAYYGKCLESVEKLENNLIKTILVHADYC